MSLLRCLLNKDILSKEEFEYLPNPFYLSQENRTNNRDKFNMDELLLVDTELGAFDNIEYIKNISSTYTKIKKINEIQTKIDNNISLNISEIDILDKDRANTYLNKNFRIITEEEYNKLNKAKDLFIKNLRGEYILQYRMDEIINEVKQGKEHINIDGKSFKLINSLLSLDKNTINTYLNLCTDLELFKKYYNMLNIKNYKYYLVIENYKKYLNLDKTIIYDNNSLEELKTNSNDYFNIYIEKNKK